MTHPRTTATGTRSEQAPAQRTTRGGTLPAGAPHPGREAGGARVPAIELRNARLGLGERTLWKGLDLTVEPGEYFAVLGANGTGKTSFLKVLLGLLPLAEGTVRVNGLPAGDAARHVGYVPQQRGFDPRTPLRARDLVGLGITGHRWGLPWPSRMVRHRVDRLLEHVGATAYADVPVGELSGGEQQRLRVAQALAGDPSLVLCDEALLSLDLHHQHVVSELVERQRSESGAAVVFVTHDINPIIEHVDRILYLAQGSFRIGTPDEVLTSPVLSELYGTGVEVFRSNGRVIVAGAGDSTCHPHVHGGEQ